MNFKGLNVGEFMDALRRHDPDEPVKYDFVHFGPTTLESYRGFYEDVALGYDDVTNGRYDYPTVRSLLTHFEATLGKVFEGWKGGNGRPVTRDTDLWVANPGETGNTVIVGVQELVYVTILTRHEDERDLE